MNPSHFPYNKSQRLKKRKQIAKLFESGKSKLFYPLLFRWTSTPNPLHSNPLFGVSVSKKRHKQAVQRNLIKRRIRESYRLHQHLLLPASESNNTQLNIMAVYVSNDVLSYALIEKAMIKGLTYINNNNNSNIS